MNNRYNSKILVTGGAGYVGSQVANALATLGFNVAIIDLIRPITRKIQMHPNIRIITGDLRDPDTVLMALENIDAVVHLAADIGSLTYMQEHQADILTNNMAIDTVLYSSMRKAGIKLILYSSSSMVFQNSPVFPYIEDDLRRVNLPTNIYGFSKLAGEYFCKAYHRQYGLNYVIMRYHNIYGPGEDFKGSSFGDIHVIPALVHKVLAGQYPLEILGDPHATRPFTYLSDAVDATVQLVNEALSKNKKVLNEDFNIGPDHATAILDLARLVWQLLGDGRPFRYTQKTVRAVTAVRREMNPQKIMDALNWRPKVALDEGIKQVAAWVKESKK